MARKGPKVLLGFEDECITEKHKSLVNFTTNKVGGKPDWPVDGIPQPLCQLCGLSLPLVLQIYAPLENSPYHRTLYLFGCINPNCWNQNESWVCIRSQSLEAGSDTSGSTVKTLSTSDWCADADDWEEDNNGNNNEENGNVIGRIESYFSDEEDETEDDVQVRLGSLSVDDRNANWGGGRGVTAGAGAGAVGRLHSPAATAEIEGDESEVVSIDTPTAPQHDLTALLQEVAPLPMELHSVDSNRQHYSFPTGPPQFAASFVSVGEEDLPSSPSVTPVSEHVRELLQEYQQNSDDATNPQQEKNQGEQLTQEKYEKSIPAHGDRMFHHFVSRIQHHPGQILRYCRESIVPLLLYPLQDFPATCAHCHNKMLFEMQVLPTLIPKLRLLGPGGEGVHLEFGTVLVFTCRQSCWASADTWREERVVVQAERI
ncbi:programmed cell death protein 2-like [Periplaneta americana]|uniref:programmed cell death protein 2-like n=1 Tax=Periplaneta americana TaxID=6978 RepID=UPI0037E9191C